VGGSRTSHSQEGALCLFGPPDTSRVLVERSRFEGNEARSGAALAQYVQTRDAVLRDCVFAGNRGHYGPAALRGIFGEVSHNRFQGNELESELGVAMVEGTSAMRVVHNIFVDNHVGRGASALISSRGLVANNLFVRNTCVNEPGSSWCTGAVWIVMSSAVDLRNNTFVDNSSEDGNVHLSYDSPFGAVHSNLFVGGTGAYAVGTDYPEWGAAAALTYNGWWNAPEPVWDEGITLGDGNVEADPLFAGGDDFQLGAGSTAIDAGDPDPTLDDVDGTRNDLGAFGGPEGDWTPLPEGGAP